MAYIKAGIGGEFIPATNELCIRFAEHFKYRQTVGGTATRAAIAISRLGCESSLSMCCFNEQIRRLLPQKIHYFSNVGDASQTIYPHVILSYPAGERLCVNNIDMITSRENRLMYSNDDDAKSMMVSAEFSSWLTDADAFLLGCFSEVLDRNTLKERMESTGSLFRSMKDSAWIVLEDGCYIKKEFRYYVHQSLRKFLDVISMNEDELQEYIEKRIDVFDYRAVLEEISVVYGRLGVPVLVVHSAGWALAYGERPERLKAALYRGICLSATRFRYGDDFDKKEYEKTERLAPKAEGAEFCRNIKKLAGDKICCLPTKDLSFVKHPTIVGLGDFFAGGLVYGLAETEK